MQAFIEATNATLTLGDESVPPVVAAVVGDRDCGSAHADPHLPAGGLRPLEAAAFAAVEQIVLGANGVKLPGVPPDTDVVGATEALTAFYTSVCAPATPTTPTTPTTPSGGTTAATPVAAAAHFTG